MLAAAQLAEASKMRPSKIFCSSFIGQVNDKCDMACYKIYCVLSSKESEAMLLIFPGITQIFATIYLYSVGSLGFRLMIFVKGRWRRINAAV